MTCKRWPCHASVALLVQRGRVMNVLTVLFLLPSAAVSVAQRPGGWTGVAAIAAFFVGTIALCDAGGLVASRISPEAEPAEGVSTAAMLWYCLCQTVWSLAFIAAFMVTYGSTAARYWPASVAVLCLLARAVVVKRERRRVRAWTARILTELESVIS